MVKNMLWIKDNKRIALVNDICILFAVLNVLQKLQYKDKCCVCRISMHSIYDTIYRNINPISLLCNMADSLSLTFNKHFNIFSLCLTFKQPAVFFVFSNVAEVTGFANTNALIFLFLKFITNWYFQNSHLIHVLFCKRIFQKKVYSLLSILHY